MKILATTLISAGIFYAHGATQAMTLNPRGTGQVLLYPYYTVNAHQQTLVTVSNVTDAAKLTRVRFREGFNGREVLEFELFLAAHSTWTSVVFSLDDAGLSGAGAGILLNDGFCTAPLFASVNKLQDGRLYQQFLDYAYIGAQEDSGPTDDTRTREGYFEIIEVAELTGATRTAITPVNGVPPNCTSVANGLPPAADVAPPTGGLSGSLAIINVPVGTYYATTATALDGVFNQAIISPPGTEHPDLADASVGAGGNITAYVPIDGTVVTLNYPQAQAIDAASAVLAASEIITDYDVAASEGAQTDWVITFPTKHFYVDRNIVTTTNQALPPFEELFGANSPSRSGVTVKLDIYNHDGDAQSAITGVPPPPQPLPPQLPYEMQVVTFLAPGQSLSGASPALAAANPLGILVNDGFTVGVAHLNLSGGPVGAPHLLRGARDGKQLQGLPAIGFEAINYVNGNAQPGVLANYSASIPMRARAPCVVSYGASGIAACP